MASPRKPGKIPTPVVAATPSTNAAGFAPFIVFGTDGADTLLGTTLRDTLVGRDGSDVIRGGNSDDSLDGGNGNDSVFGDRGNDTLLGGAGNDLLDGGSGNDRINDTIGDNFAKGGDGNDTVTTGDGNDTILGDYDTAGGGNDRIEAGNGDNSVLGGNGNDTIVAGLGGDTIDGGAGDDSVVGGEGNNRVLGGAGNDTIVTGSGSDTIDAGSGNDSVLGGDGADNIAGGAGSDRLFGGNGDDSITDSDGSDLISGGAGSDVISVSGNGSDTISGDDGDDSIVASSGSASILGGNGSDTVVTGNGNDVVSGGNGNDSISGGSGNDLLFGEAGDDTLVAGLGSDTLVGGVGNNVFVFDTGSGTSGINRGPSDFLHTADSVVGTSSEAAGVVATINIDTLRFTGSAALVVGVQKAVTGFTSVGFAGNPTVSTALNGLTHAVSSGAFNPADANANVFLNSGQARNNPTTLSSGPGDITIESFLSRTVGIDRIELGSGNDRFSLYTQGPTTAVAYLDGGAGNDLLIGTVLLNDTIIGGDGNDTIRGYENNDSLTGDAGNDLILGDDGNDTLIGGNGSDTLLGGNGNDAFVANEGEQTVGGAFSDSINGGDGTLDTIVLRGNGVVFDVGSVASGAGVTDVELVAGTDGNDFIRFGNAFTVASVSGGAGDDTIIGGNSTVAGSNQFLDGGVGNDSILGGSGNDTVLGGTGSDTLSGGSGSDSLLGGDGNDLFSANDTTSVTGDSGNDTLSGGSGDDRFVFNTAVSVTGGGAGELGTGDRIIGGNGTDTLEFSSGVGAPGATVTLNSPSVQSVEILRLNASSNIGVGDTGIDSIFGSEFDDTLVGSRRDETFVGGDGVDSLVGDAGNDVFFVTTTHEFGIASAELGIGPFDTVSGGDGFDTLVFDFEGSGSTEEGTTLDAGYTLYDSVAGAVTSVEALVFGRDSDRIQVAENLLANNATFDLTVEGDEESDYQGVVLIDAGAGDNVVVVDGDDDGVSGSLGYSIPRMQIYAGNDNDLVVVQDAYDSANLFIDVQDGNDSIAIEATRSLAAGINLGGGDDVLLIGAASGGGFNAGEDLDSRFEGLGNVDDGFAGIVHLSTVDGGDGNDLVVIQAEDLRGHFHLDDGDDTVSAAVQYGEIHDTTIDLGDGDNVVDLLTANDLASIVPQTPDLALFDGRDIARVTVTSGDGRDEITLVSGEDMDDISIVSGDGEDTVELYASLDGEDGSITNTTIDAGDGDNRVGITATDSIGTVSIVSGSGSDQINLATATYGVARNVPDLDFIGGNIEDVIISSGDGQDDISLVSGDSISDATIVAGAGDDGVVLTLTSGYSFADGNIHDAVVDLGTGDDSFVALTSDESADDSSAPGGFIGENSSIYDLTVSGGDGGDIVFLSASDDIHDVVADLGDGDDSFVALASDVSGFGEGSSVDDLTVTGGVGEDLVLLSASDDIHDVVADLGDGDDNSFVAFAGDLSGPEGFSPESDIYNLTVTGGVGEDLVALVALNDIRDVVVDTGDADDFVLLAADPLHTAGNIPVGELGGNVYDVTISTDGGNDFVQVFATHEINNVVIEAGSGDDTIGLLTSDDVVDALDISGPGGASGGFDGGGIYDATVDAGAGDDVLTVVAGGDIGASGEDIINSFMQLLSPVALSGADAAGAVSIAGGDGNDSIELYADLDGVGGFGSIGAVQVDGGAGDDTVVAAASDTVLFSFFDVGDGNNVVEIITNTDLGTVEGYDLGGRGDGQDESDNGIALVGVTAGDGDDTISLVADDISLVAPLSAFGGEDSDVSSTGIFAGNGDNVVHLYADLADSGEDFDRGEILAVGVSAGFGNDTVLVAASGNIEAAVFELGDGNNILSVSTSSDLGLVEGYELHGGNIAAVTVSAGDGDDQITFVAAGNIGQDASGGGFPFGEDSNIGVSIDVGSGDDAIKLYASLGEDFSFAPGMAGGEVHFATVQAGDGDDVIDVAASRSVHDSQFELGAGNDVIGIYTSSDLGDIEGQYSLSGEDIFNVTISGGDDDDTITLVSAGSIGNNPDLMPLSVGEDGEIGASIDGGTGDDVIKVYADLSDDRISFNGNDSNVISHVTIEGGDGDDDVTLAVSGNVDEVSVSGGDGDDVVRVLTGTQLGSVEGYSFVGNDVGGNDSDPDNDIDDVTVDGGAGDDDILVVSSDDIDGVSVDGSDGDDLIGLYAAIDSNEDGKIDDTTVVAGAGDDTVIAVGVGEGNDAVEDSLFVLGDGDDVLRVLSSTDLGPIEGYAFEGEDGYRGNIDDVTVIAGDGQDDITMVSSYTIEDTYIAGNDGDDVISLYADLSGQGNSSVPGVSEGNVDDTTVVGGNGSDTVFVATIEDIEDSLFDLGQGDNIVRLVTDSALDVIRGYEEADGLDDSRAYDLQGDDIQRFTVTAGDGDDLITVVAGDNIGDSDGLTLIDAGNGDNVIELYAGIRGDSSDLDGNIEVTVGSGNDVVTVYASNEINESQFHLGNGDNEITLATTTDLGTIEGFEYHGHIVGNETFGFDGGDIDEVTVTAGNGDDLITLVSGYSLGNSYIEAGDGDNIVKLYADLGARDHDNVDGVTYGNVDSVTLLTGNGDDDVFVAAGEDIRNSRFDLGDGDNTLVLTTYADADSTEVYSSAFAGFVWEGGNVEDITVTSGSGDDVLILAAGNSIGGDDTVGGVLIRSGAGDDRIELHTAGEDGITDTVSGDAFVAISIDGGDGYDTVVLDGYAGGLGEDGFFDNSDFFGLMGNVEALILGDNSEGDISFIDAPIALDGDSFDPAAALFGTDNLRYVQSNNSDNLIFIETAGNLEDVVIDGAGGDDSFVLGAVDFSADLVGEPDQSFASNFDDVTLSGGSGEDFALIYTDHEDAHLTFTGMESIFVVAGEDANHVDIDIVSAGNLDDNFVLRTGFPGSSADIHFQDVANATVVGGLGGDAVYLHEGGKLSLLEGEDFLSLLGGGDSSGGGFPLFDIGSGGGTSVESVFGLDFKDFVFVTDSLNDDTITSSLDYLDLGGNDDYLLIQGNNFAVGGILDGGTGDDLLQLVGVGEDSLGGLNLGEALIYGFETVLGGNLSDAIHIASGAEFVAGGEDNDWIMIDSGAVTVVGDDWYSMADGGMGGGEDAVGGFDFIQAGDGAQLIFGGDLDDSSSSVGGAGGNDVFFQDWDDGVAATEVSVSGAGGTIQLGDSLTFGDGVDLIFDFSADTVSGGSGSGGAFRPDGGGDALVFGELLPAFDSLVFDGDGNDSINGDFDGVHDVFDADGILLFRSLVKLPSDPEGLVVARNLDDESVYYARGFYVTQEDLDPTVDSDGDDDSTNDFVDVTPKFVFDELGDDLLFLRTDGDGLDNQSLFTNKSIVILLDVSTVGVSPSDG